MSLIRFGTPGREQPGVMLSDGTRLDLSDYIADYTPEFFAAGGLDRVKRLVGAHKDKLPRVGADVRLGSPVARPHKFFAVGLNYRKHAQEVGADIPTEPILFTKHTSCIQGPNDDVVRPRGSQKLDYEVELAFVMKDTVRYLSSEDTALQHVAGFTICNDVSERDFQMNRGGQWFKGKSCDTFGPLGPVLVATEDLPDYDRLQVKTVVDGEVRQDSNTDDLIFGVPHIVWYLSQFVTLEPGDVITTGTPSGVGMGFDPPKWLEPGQTMEVSIAKLGTQVQKIVDAK